MGKVIDDATKSTGRSSLALFSSTSWGGIRPGKDFWCSQHVGNNKRTQAHLVRELVQEVGILELDLESTAKAPPEAAAQQERVERRERAREK